MPAMTMEERFIIVRRQRLVDGEIWDGVVDLVRKEMANCSVGTGLGWLEHIRNTCVCGNREEWSWKGLVGPAREAERRPKKAKKTRKVVARERRAEL